MYNSRKLADKAISRLLDVITIRIHVEACKECGKKYREIEKHIEKLEKP